MKKIIIACTIATIFAVPNLAHADTKSVAAKETHKETVIGLSTSAILGGFDGGSIGAFVDAFAGGLVGDNYEENMFARRVTLTARPSTQPYSQTASN